MLIKIKTKSKTKESTLYFECVYCKVNYSTTEKVISSIDIKRENGADKENISMKDKELYINSEKTKNNRMKVKVLSSFFIPFEYKVRVMWKYHVGVIGVEETLQIEEMLII